MHAQRIRALVPDFHSDPWGYAMGLFFDVAAELYNRGSDIPGEWGYRPSPLGVDSDVELELVVLSDDDVRAIGQLLYRYTRAQERAGNSY